MKCSLTLLLLLMGVVSGDNVINFGSTIEANESLVLFSYTVTQSVRLIGCAFSIQTEQYSNVVMMVDINPISVTLSPKTLSYLYLQQGELLKTMDVQRVISNDIQLVNLKFSTTMTGLTLYFAFFNFDVQAVGPQKTYALSVRTYTNPGIVCFSCPSGTSRMSGSCQCVPCRQDYYGQTCNLYEPTMKEGENYKVDFYTVSNYYFRIVNPPEEIVLSYVQSKPTNQVKLYIQEERVVGAVAGYLNTYYDDSGLPYSRLVTTSAMQWTIKPKGKTLSLTLHGSASIPFTTVSISFKNPNSSKLSLILGLSLGLTFGLIIIIFICFKYRKHKQQKTVPLDSVRLNRSQIDLYYPQVDGILVLKQELNESLGQLALLQESSSRVQNQHHQCSVCLNQLEAKQKMRITYCKHIFHSKCLTNWFKKNQNCPFCRHDCSRDPTEEIYEELKDGRKQFDKRALVGAILKRELKQQSKPVQELIKQQVEEVEPKVEYEIEDQMEYQPQSLEVPLEPRGSKRKFKAEIAENESRTESIQLEQKKIGQL